MKGIIAMILVSLMALFFSGCAENSDKGRGEVTETPTEVTVVRHTEIDPPVTGGVTDSESPVVPEEIKSMFEKINREQMTGAQLTPYAYLGSQVVAGTNHFVLCKMTATVPDKATAYALVTVYEDVDGHAAVTDIQESGVSAPEPYDPNNPVSGGWGEPTSPVVTDAVRNALEKACEDLNGVTYEAKAYLAMQVVAGYNYMLLCEVTPNVPDPESHYALVTVYSDLDGGAEITHEYDFTA